MKKQVILCGKTQREHAKRLVDDAPPDYVVTIEQMSRSIQANRLMWALIQDMQRQNAGMAQFTPNQVKLRFLNALDNEMQFLPELWGGGMFAVGQSSSVLTKGQFSMLIELMFKWGAENDIKWSQKAQATYDACNRS